MTIQTPTVVRDRPSYQPFDLNATLHEGENKRVHMAKTITVRVPVRIDLAGGWTDVPIYCNDHVGEVVNLAINRYITAEMHIDDERRISVKYESDVPVGSGLGTSAAMNVALLSTIIGGDKTPDDIAELAFQFEALLGNTGGRQDQWASAHGGLQHLTFNGNEVVTRQLHPSAQFFEQLERNLLLFDSGITHVSGELHDSVWKRYSKGDDGVVEALHRIRHMVTEMLEAIKTEYVQGVGLSMFRTLQSVNLLDRAFNAPFDRFLRPLWGISVIGWKAMGAGAGGVVGVMLEQEGFRKEVIAHAEKQGWRHIDWKVEHQGIQRSVNLHE